MWTEKDSDQVRKQMHAEAKAHMPRSMYKHFKDALDKKCEISGCEKKTVICPGTSSTVCYDHSHPMMKEMFEKMEVEKEA